MVRSVTAAVALVAVVTAAAAHAQQGDASACYTIGSQDARNYCLAKARKEPSMCYAIQASDLRAACLSEVRR